MSVVAAQLPNLYFFLPRRDGGSSFAHGGRVVSSRGIRARPYSSSPAIKSIRTSANKRPNQTIVATKGRPCPLETEKCCNRSDEDRRRGLVGQRAKAAASLLISRCFAAGPKSIRGCRFQVRRSRQSRSESLAPSPSSHRFVCRLAADTGAGV